MKTTITFNAAVAVCKAIVLAARVEISSRNLTSEERFAVRGSALGAIDNVYYDLLCEKGRDKLRNMAAGQVASCPARDILLQLAGWEDCP